MTVYNAEANQPVSETYKLHRRFDRFARLTGDEGMEKLMNSFVVVFGLAALGATQLKRFVGAALENFASSISTMSASPIRTVSCMR